MSKNNIFAIADLVKRLDAIASENRYDQVSRLMHEVYEKKMEKNPTLTVSAAEIRDVYNDVHNMNPASNFADNLSEAFPKDAPMTISEGSPFRIAGWEEDFRPTPTEVQKSEEEIIKDASFSLLKKVATGNITNPQYHFGQFVNIPKAGPNSGVALWTVAFTTKRGTATVSVPVNVLGGTVQNPEVFYPTGAGKAIAFTPENLREFSSSYEPAYRSATTELSGFNNLGANTIITERQDIKEASLEEAREVQEVNNIQLSYTVPIDDALTSNVGAVEASFNRAINEARAYVERKVRTGDGKQNMNVNIQISYSGALGLDGQEIDQSSKDVSGVFAFNASQKTRNGLKTITIPVILANNQMQASEFYTENGAQPLSTANVAGYFASENVESRPQTSSEPTEAFTEAFTAYLKNDATYSQIMEEVKGSIRDGEFVKAASYLEIISARFGEKALKQASDDYINFVKQASSERMSEQHDTFFISSNIGFQG